MSHPAYYQTTQESYSSHQPYRPGDYVPQVCPSLDFATSERYYDSVCAHTDRLRRINSNFPKTVTLPNRLLPTARQSHTNMDRMNQRVIASPGGPQGTTTGATVAIAEPSTDAIKTITETIGKINTAAAIIVAREALLPL